MDFFDVVEARRSIRAFQERPVEEEKIACIMDAVNLAPSAGNLQAYEVYLVTRNDLRADLANAALDQEFIAQAPLVLVFCAHPARSAVRYGRRGERLYALQDATIACTFATLAAAALGLGSVWVGAFDEEAVRRVLDAPRGVIPIAILPIGYPAENPPRRPRRGADDFVHRVG
ncbi:MAG: nitroreductase [Anaerolineae bacterium]|nr:MAG: nitroreductase [Anaerolineae bacterium]